MPDRLVLLGSKGGPALRPGGPWPSSWLLRIGGREIVVDCGLGVTRGLVDSAYYLWEACRSPSGLPPDWCWVERESGRVVAPPKGEEGRAAFGFEAFRAYYRYLPKGPFSVEYTVRLNNPGTFGLPQTRMEAMYSPEMFGESPNGAMVVKP